MSAERPHSPSQDPRRWYAGAAAAAMVMIDGIRLLLGTPDTVVAGDASKAGCAEAPRAQDDETAQVQPADEWDLRAQLTRTPAHDLDTAIAIREQLFAIDQREGAELGRLLWRKASNGDIQIGIDGRQPVKVYDTATMSRAVFVARCSDRAGMDTTGIVMLRQLATSEYAEGHGRAAAKLIKAAFADIAALAPQWEASGRPDRAPKLRIDTGLAAIAWEPDLQIESEGASVSRIVLRAIDQRLVTAPKDIHAAAAELTENAGLIRYVYGRSDGSILDRLPYAGWAAARTGPRTMEQERIPQPPFSELLRTIDPIRTL